MNIDINSLEQDVTDIMSSLQDALSGVSLNRAHACAIEKIIVRHKDGSNILMHIATIKMLSDRELLVSPWAVEHSNFIVTALEQANTPFKITKDGKGTIRLELAVASADKKRKATLQVHNICQKHIDSVRDHRRKIRNTVKSSVTSKDELYVLLTQIDKITSKAEQLIQAKRKEYEDIIANV